MTVSSTVRSAASMIVSLPGSFSSKTSTANTIVASAPGCPAGAGRAPIVDRIRLLGLKDIWNFYTAPDAPTLEGKAKVLSDIFEQLEQRLINGPYFEGKRFSLVDAVFGPVFPVFRCLRPHR